MDIVDVLEVASKAAPTRSRIVATTNRRSRKAATRSASLQPDPKTVRAHGLRIAQLSVIDVLSVGVSLLHSETCIANLEKSRKALVRKRY
jgi:DNA-binding MurR/RpiR family transcriptional regulator